MRIISLGGAGAMGRLAVRDLISKDKVKELTIADYSLSAAESLARELGDKCTAKKIDANNHSELVDAVRGYDVALGTIGPFYKYETKMARACIEAGVNYVSICDDYDAAAAILELDKEAKKAGITMITGVGWTPGVTNVFARRAANQLDEVEEIAVAWGCHTSDTVGKAVTLHTLHIFTGTIPSYQGGRTVWTPAGSGCEKLRFPKPVGEVYVYHVGHPEPVTIPRYINAKTVTLKGGLVENYLSKLSMMMAHLHLTNTPKKKAVLGAIINPMLPFLEMIGKPAETCSACRVDITGKKEGKWVRIAYGAAAHMDLLTGLPASVAVQMIGEGLVKKKGVMAPEACLDPPEFLKRLEAGGIRLYEGDDMITPLKI
ncbi:MAG: saccharopine dehydrogenase NADP-binding domain-containing protein [Deltaproteobacteria bacterium]|nr:saccharopine dehydrogenase NADP-binding domain-containing protein [Deltaproteobacteria bacterium]